MYVAMNIAACLFIGALYLSLRAAILCALAREALEKVRLKLRGSMPEK